MNGATGIPGAELPLQGVLGGLNQADEDVAIPLLMQAALDNTVMSGSLPQADEDAAIPLLMQAALEALDDGMKAQDALMAEEGAVYSQSDAGYNLKNAVSAYGPSSTLKNFNIRGAMSATWVQLEALVQQYFFNGGGAAADTAGASYYDDFSYDLGYDNLGYDIGYSSGYPDALDLEGGGMGRDAGYDAYPDYNDVAYSGFDSSSSLEAYADYEYPYYYSDLDGKLPKGQSITGNRRLLRGKKQ